MFSRRNRYSEKQQPRPQSLPPQDDLLIRSPVGPGWVRKSLSYCIRFIQAELDARTEVRVSSGKLLCSYAISDSLLRNQTLTNQSPSFYINLTTSSTTSKFRNERTSFEASWPGVISNDLLCINAPGRLTVYHIACDPNSYSFQ